jgi:hypothetical protein
MKRKLLIHAFAVFLFSIVLLSSAQAQFRASIRGVITDPQGAVVPGATVTLVNKATNQKFTATSDSNGIYQFNALQSAPYQLTVDAKDFQQKVFENVSIIPDQPNGLDVQLQLKGAATNVTVTDTVQTLQTETASLSGTISTQQIQNMPSFGRDVFKLVQLAPGVFSEGQGSKMPTTQGPGGTEGNAGIFQTENGPQAVANGQQYENNGYSIDGVSTTSAVWGGTTIITPSEDAVQDVKVVSNAYDAEYGRFAGAQVQVTSKSGTNNLHGSAFFTAHRPGLDAYRWVGQNTAPQRDDNFFSQFGASGGGPIWKNKIFAFFAWETVRSPKVQNSAASAWYETPDVAAMAPANSIAAKYLAFPGSRPATGSMNPMTCANAGLVEGVTCRAIAGKGLDIGSPLTSGLGTQDLSWVDSAHPGLGNGFDGIADIANYNIIQPSNYSKNQYIGRVDANVTSKDRLTGSIYWVPQSNTGWNGNRPYDINYHDQVNNAFTLIWNRTISSTFVNEARFNAAGWRWNELETNPQTPLGLPADSINKIGSATIENFGPNAGSHLNQWTYSYKDVATKVFGRNTLKFGFDLTRLYYLNNCVGCGIPNYGFFNLWDFLNDAPKSEGWNSFDPHTGLPSTQRQDDRENLLGIFVHNDVRLRRNLTLNLGLRWSYFGPLYAKQNNMYRATPGAGSGFLTGLKVAKNNSWDSQNNNFGPQVGFAWSPGKFNDKLVIRGGYGLNYNQFEIALSANIQGNPGTLVGQAIDSSNPATINPLILYAISSDPHSYTGYPPNPNFIVQFGPNGLPTTGSAGVGIFPNPLPTTRVHHYSLDAQYEIADNWVATVGYQGSASRNIYYHQNPNAMAAQLGYPLNPQISGGDYWGLNGYANYNAMNAELSHQFGHGFMVDTQFTWSKSLDTGSGPYIEQVFPTNPDSSYGLSDYDVNKSFKIYGSYTPNIFQGNSLLAKTLGGWTISGIFNLHTGFPWTPMAFFGGSGNMYCGICYGYDHLPAVYLGGAGNSTSNDAYMTGSNFPAGGTHYFMQPSTGTLYPGGSSATGGSNPQVVPRNSLRGPGYRSVDATLVKSFGLPKAPVLGENARIEFRVDAYNLFNNLNLLGGSQSVESGHIVNDINQANFGQSTGSYPGRVVTLGARFNF